jgi:hypothetical protein
MASFRTSSLPGFIATIAIAGTSGLLPAQAPAKILEIRGKEALAKAAESVIVSQTDFVLNEAPSRIAQDYPHGPDAIWNRFVNTPDERRFSGLVTEGGDELWPLFSQNLVAIAKKQGLDSATLNACWNTLNYGRNREPADYPSVNINTPFIPLDTTEEEKRKFAAEEKERRREFVAFEKYWNENIEKFYPDDLPIVPVGAHLANHPNGQCWIIICKWEYRDPELKPGQETNTVLGHVKVWAMDTKTQQVLAIVSCD